MRVITSKLIFFIVKRWDTWRAKKPGFQKSLLYALEFLIKLQVLMTLPSQLPKVLVLYTVLAKHFIKQHVKKCDKTPEGVL